MITRILTSILIIATISGFAGNNDNEPTRKKYRVVAIKKGDAQIKSVSNTVDVSKKVFVYIPNAFTPDGDGINDQFGAKGEGIAQYSLAIYNRWGETIFTSNQITHQWDGTYKGQKAPQGSYVYEMVAKNEEGNDFVKKKGSVTLLR